MNTVNPEQSAANRSNVDFKPLIDHFSAIECARRRETNAPSIAMHESEAIWSMMRASCLIRFDQVRDQGGEG